MKSTYSWRENIPPIHSECKYEGKKTSGSACLFSKLCEFHLLSIEKIPHDWSYRCYNSKSVLIVLIFQVKKYICVYIYISLFLCYIVTIYLKVFILVYIVQGSLPTLDLANYVNHRNQS